MPFRVVYILSDFTAWLLGSVIKYRKDVVFMQLKKSFPNKSDEEINHIAIESYRNLADIFLESVKGFSISKSEYMKRYTFVNPEISEKYTQAGIPVVNAAAHYTNWEWGATTYPLWFTCPVYGFYKPLSNPKMEQYGRKMRGIFNMNLIPIKNTSKVIIANENAPAIYVFIADQSTWSDNAHWVTFLGQDTACPQGVGKYGNKLNCPVIYAEMNRVKRGFYEVNLVELLPNNHNISAEEITSIYMNHLENILKAKPENWLWSHKRWKKKRIQ